MPFQGPREMLFSELAVQGFRFGELGSVQDVGFGILGVPDCDELQTIFS